MFAYEWLQLDLERIHPVLTGSADGFHEVMIAGPPDQSPRRALATSQWQTDWTLNLH